MPLSPRTSRTGVALLRVLVVLAVVAATIPLVGQHQPVAAQQQPVLHLTFDDGPDPTFTPRLLDLLDRYGAKATFFPVGKRIERQFWLTSQLTSRGHAVGNHSYNHPNYRDLSDDEMRGEIRAASKIIDEATGSTPRCMRPPSGTFDTRIARIASEENLAVTLWNRGGNDYGLRDAEEFLDKVRGAQPGDIILLHDNAGATSVQAAALVLEHFSALGYAFVAVPECVGAATAPPATSTTTTTRAPRTTTTAAPTPTTTTTPPATSPRQVAMASRAVTFRAKGTTGSEILKLRVNRSTVARFRLSTNWTTFTYRPTRSTKVTKVRIFFMNDGELNGIDRNATVDYITVHNAVIQTEDKSVKSRGTWSASNGCGPGFKQQESLACKGWFQYKLKRPKVIG